MSFISGDQTCLTCKDAFIWSVEDIFVFLDLWVLISDNLFMYFCRRNVQVPFAEKPQVKLLSCQRLKASRFTWKYTCSALNKRLDDKELNLNKWINYIRTLGPKCLRSVLRLTLYFRCLKMWYSCEFSSFYH